MASKMILLVGLASVILTGLAGEYPFIVFRLTGSPNNKPAWQEGQEPVNMSK